MTGHYDTAVLLATFDGGKYLGRQLDSLMAQSVSDFVVCFHDDGSSDSTLDILSDYEKKYPGRFVRIDGRSTGSAKANFFYLMKNVDADIYFFCDQDDVWDSTKIQKERQRLSIAGDLPAAVYCDMRVVDSNEQVIADSFLDTLNRRHTGNKITDILVDNPAAGCTMCFNRSLRDAVTEANIDTDMIEMHDGFLLCAASLLGYIDYMDEPLVGYRQHGSNEMGAKSESVTERVNRNIKDLLSHRMQDERKAFHMISRNMAGQLSKLTGLTQDDRRLLMGYSNLAGRTKARRIYFLHKNRFKRAKHTLWFYLWS